MQNRKGLLMSLKHVILVALSGEPLTGYEITKEFDLVLGNFWHATHQQVYRELKIMTEGGLVEFETKAQAGKPDRKVYRTTKSGQTELESWLAEPLPSSAVKNLLLVKLYACSDHEILQRHIAAFKAECFRALETYRQTAERHYTEQVDQMEPWKQRAWLTLRYGIAQREAQLSWTKEVEVSLFDNGACTGD
jgi:PadR family transcriptional regulator, regulatory protein AphA